MLSLRVEHRRLEYFSGSDFTVGPPKHSLAVDRAVTVMLVTISFVDAIPVLRTRRHPCFMLPLQTAGVGSNFSRKLKAPRNADGSLGPVNLSLLCSFPQVSDHGVETRRIIAQDRKEVLHRELKAPARLDCLDRGIPLHFHGVLHHHFAVHSRLALLDEDFDTRYEAKLAEEITCVQLRFDLTILKHRRFSDIQEIHRRADGCLLDDDLSLLEALHLHTGDALVATSGRHGVEELGGSFAAYLLALEAEGRRDLRARDESRSASSNRRQRSRPVVMVVMRGGRSS
mmetsp:Transcript_7570/g.25762  ORF Transcript_7570/g.25762 Transcript_7570/m.25762 type:complete len:285 (+) Transcript_7570:1591-2445(+)